MLATINTRAKFPADVANFANAHGIDYKSLLSVNPKTEKSKVQTYILHLTPADTSGVINVCTGAGNCRKVCLHFAGNPVFMNNKQKARIRRTVAFAADKKAFSLLVLCAILDKINKHAAETIAIRLNGTSDIPWEEIDFMISPEFARFCRVKFGAVLPVGQRNLFEVLNFMRSVTGEDVRFYDYTKIKRNWAECRRLGYHLTVSYDGADNIANHKIVASALSAGVNVAAAFAIKKGQPLPPVAYIANRSFKVVDGDLTDYRPADPAGFTIIGLRFKLPHGIPYSAAERDAFCLDGHGLTAALKPV
jgi:hypothetical protein